MEHWTYLPALGHTRTISSTTSEGQYLSRDCCSDQTTYKKTVSIFVGLEGEHLGLYKGEGLAAMSWSSHPEPPKNQPLTWYKAIVEPPSGDEPVGLDMIHMSKGLAWLNGEEIGRYWLRKGSIHGKCVRDCDYRGKFSPDKCDTGCGEPTQRWYHVPRSWFKPSGNILVIFEEIGGDPTQIRFSRRKFSSVCALVSEDQPSFPLESFQLNGTRTPENGAAVKLKCPRSTRISMVKFASFGTPTGACRSYSIGECHDPNSLFVVEKVCLNKNECSIELADESFDQTLCPGVTKELGVEAVCN